MRASKVCGVCLVGKELGKDCRPCARRRNREYKERNKERVREARSSYKKALWASRAEERREAREARRSSLPLRRKQARLAWKKANTPKLNANTAKRFAQKLKATPGWANAFFVEEAYSLALLRTKMLGYKWQVDHIVPLRSKIVCGLHCEQNLQVVSATYNMVKGNRFWPGMPGGVK